MPLNAAEKAFFDQLATYNAEHPEEANQPLTLELVRGWSKGMTDWAGEPADVPYKDINIPVRDGDQINARIFNPQLSTTHPCLVFFQGNGYVSDNFYINTVACSRIANYANAKVILVDIRKCPEFPLPIPMQDAYDATVYISKNADSLHIDTNNLSIAGASSGAHAAAYVNHQSRFNDDLKIRQYISISGCFDLTNSQRDYDDFEAEDGLFKRGPIIDFILNLWGADLKDPLISPVFDDSLTDLPKTIILIPEYDGLRNDAEAYYKHLKRLGNDVTRIELPGQTHNTIILRNVLSDGIDPAKVIADLLAPS